MAKKLNTNSNAYTIVYAAVMVIIVAFLLAFISSALKPTQDANVANDTKGQILTALGYDKATIDVAETFKTVQDNLFENGELVPYEGEFNTSYGALIKAGTLHIFKANTQDGQIAYVLPVIGRGLWGGLWGYIAVNEEKNTVLGTYFYHEGETAGLGARIGDRDFQEQFIGKPLKQGDKVLTVVKSGSAKDETEVDGVTGATLTSNGVAAMVQESIVNIYSAFLGGVTAAPAGHKCCGKCKESGEGCQGACGDCESACGDCEGGCEKAEAACPMGGCCKKCEQN